MTMSRQFFLTESIMLKPDWSRHYSGMHKTVLPDKANSKKKVVTAEFCTYIHLNPPGSLPTMLAIF